MYSGKKMKVLLKSSPTLYHSMVCSLPGSSHGILKAARKFPSPGDLPNPGIESRSPALQADSLPSEPPGKACGRLIFIPPSETQGISASLLAKLLSNQGNQSQNPFLKSPSGSFLAPALLTRPCTSCLLGFIPPTPLGCW